MSELNYEDLYSSRVRIILYYRIYNAVKKWSILPKVFPRLSSHANELDPL